MSLVGVELADHLIDTLMRNEKHWVYVVEEDLAIQAEVTTLLRANGLWVQEFSARREFESQRESLPSGCAIVDWPLEAGPAASPSELIRVDRQDLAWLLITPHPDVSTVVKAIRLGALNVLEYPFAPEDLLSSVEEALSLVVKHQERARRRSDARELLATLTAREREVLASLLEGRTSKQIARILGISNRTADVHRSHIISKLKVQNVAQAVRIALSASELAADQPAEQPKGLESEDLLASAQRRFRLRRPTARCRG